MTGDLVAHGARRYEDAPIALSHSRAALVAAKTHASSGASTAEGVGSAFAATLWHDVIDHAAIVTLLLDESGVILFESGEFSRILARNRNELVGESFFAITQHANEAGLREGFARMARGEIPRLSFDFMVQTGSGKARTMAATAINSLQTASVSAIILSAYDVTQRKALEETLRQHANRDALTGLSNRRSIIRTLTRWVADAAKSRATPTVLMIDLDGFKGINDAYGHSVGDAVLIEIAKRLEALAPGVLGVARLGGDELVLYGRFNDYKRDAARVAQAIIDEVRRPILADNHWIYSSACVGIAAFPDSGHTAEELLRSADVSLHQAKAAGAGSMQWFSKEAATERRNQTRMRTELADALPAQQFRVFYQPIVRANTGIVHSHEVLLRWQHPALGLLAAGQFISMIDSAGMTDALLQWVLKEAFAQAETNPVLRARPLALNISPRSLRRKKFAAQLLHALDAAKVAPSQLEIEIVEEDFVRAVDDAPTNITELHHAGVRVIIDDFGKGFSNFGYLTRFPVYAIKIDREYVAQIGASERNETLIGALAGLAEELGIQPIGEGVETREQQDFLLHHGCVLQQGYFHGRPAPSPMHALSGVGPPK